MILRPSFVYGQGSYGGSSLFRALAGLPGFILLPGDGKFLLQPIHLDDLTAIVHAVLTLLGQHLLYVAGEEQVSLKYLLNQLRAWLGFKSVINLSVPMRLIRIAAKLGDRIYNVPLSTTGIKMMQSDNIVTQQQWHARLYGLRPLLRLSIGIMWVLSGIVSILPSQTEITHYWLTHIGISAPLQPVVLWSASLLDIFLGTATLANFKLRWTGVAQCILIILYTVLVTCFFPAFWLHPFGPLTKNIPLLLATWVMIALDSDR